MIYLIFFKNHKFHWILFVKYFNLSLYGEFLFVQQFQPDSITLHWQKQPLWKILDKWNPLLRYGMEETALKTALQHLKSMQKQSKEKHAKHFEYCCKRTFYCNDSKITEFEMIDTKNSSTAYDVMYKLIA